MTTLPSAADAGRFAIHSQRARHLRRRSESTGCSRNRINVWPRAAVAHANGAGVRANGHVVAAEIMVDRRDRARAGLNTHIVHGCQQRHFAGIRKSFATHNAPASPALPLSAVSRINGTPARRFERKQQRVEAHGCVAKGRANAARARALRACYYRPAMRVSRVSSTLSYCACYGYSAHPRTPRAASRPSTPRRAPADPPHCAHRRRPRERRPAVA